MNIALIADVYPPLRTSGAVQLRDLSIEMVRQGHRTVVLIPSHELSQPWLLEEMNGVQVLRLRAPRTKDVSYLRRTLAELLLPFFMLRNFRKSPLGCEKWDGVVWYSPTIFLGPMARALKNSSSCRSYLILRDLFPEWAVDMGLMGRGLPYQFFKLVERFQYSVADVIGVQTPSSLPYFDRWVESGGRNVEVLQNWLTDAPDTGCSISLKEGPLAGRTILVYAGNMGVAQGMDVLLELAGRLRERKDLGFLFVGRGNDAHRLRDEAKKQVLDNVLFYDEIDPAEIPGLYAQCHIGLVTLDPRHKTHNIPGKFLSYMQAGLPVLASINPGNDLVEIIQAERVGRVCTDKSVTTLQQQVQDLTAEVGRNADGISRRCRLLAKRLFAPETAVIQIMASLNNGTGRQP